MKTGETETGRVIEAAHRWRQQTVTPSISKRLEALIIEGGGKKVGPDIFEVSDVDFAWIEQRIMAAMQDDGK